MPEIAEVARTVHFVRKLLVGKTIAKVAATDDANVYGKVGTSAAEFQKHMTGKKVVDAGQQGKYFWIIMSSPPHPVMHFGMSGWLKFNSEHTYYYQPKKGGKEEDWPPKFMKFHLETKAENGEEAIEAAFVDMRRFARIRLVDCPASEIRKVSPLKENGPDPVVDKDVVTFEWLREKCRAKKLPIKAMLLDQANISGIGNWVGDEVMYNAKMHPEQYANTLSDEQIKQLHTSIHYICSTAVDLLGDSDQFPEDWLFKHRWGKGKKGTSNTMPSGEKILFLTVGGRTSAVVPSVQRKTGPVAKEMSEAEGAIDDEKPKKSKGKKRKAEMEENEQAEVRPKQTTARTKKAAVKEEEDDDQVKEAKPQVNSASNQVNGGRNVSKKGKSVKDETVGGTPASKKVMNTAENDTGRRRSGRLSKT
ncbi:formamidopyrimidine-DNA glycosylase [Exophiala aquamarina CBS 119918]|uniref:Formamidopyrimidine-DNA glycosylase n=1 Tax=Exophiala aquamarina CBS 119918 TaxID=1182545 RepID=A0A072PLR6_9EURO|nr:formamidopyrimidine-DNA glycosylase [Exophiala aquamarina CBS 119918]KEF56485.1 formamidopyrimidine-DNA glycosylase [Exophiala aquamarina CBS 119918]